MFLIYPLLRFFFLVYNPTNSILFQMKASEFCSEMSAYAESNFGQHLIKSVPVMDLVSCTPILRNMREAARRKENTEQREVMKKRKREKEEHKKRLEAQPSVSSPAKTSRTLKLFSPVKAFPHGGSGNTGVGDGVATGITTEDHDATTETTDADIIDAMREDHPHAFGFAEIKGKERSYCFAVDPYKETYDERFPYAVETVAAGAVGRPLTNPQKIRAGDDVRVVVCGRKPSRHPFSLTYTQAQQQSTVIPDLTLPHSTDIMTDVDTENLWLTVSCITATGLIHARAKHSCKKFPLDRETGLLAFPSTCVVGMKRGKNWQEAAE